MSKRRLGGTKVLHPGSPRSGDLPECTNCGRPLNTKGEVIRNLSSTPVKVVIVGSRITCGNCGFINEVSRTFHPPKRSRAS
jgi:hypothetical protein